MRLLLHQKYILHFWSEGDFWLGAVIGTTFAAVGVVVGYFFLTFKHVCCTDPSVTTILKLISTFLFLQYWFREHFWLRYFVHQHHLKSHTHFVPAESFICCNDDGSLQYKFLPSSSTWIFTTASIWLPFHLSTSFFSLRRPQTLPTSPFEDPPPLFPFPITLYRTSSSTFTTPHRHYAPATPSAERSAL